VAFNNLGYLHLESAKALLGPLPDRDGTAPASMVLQLLDQADQCCARAIQSDRTFYMAYDNRGNIARVRARVATDRAADLLDAAVESYHEALSYKPKYSAAWSDLAKAHLRLHDVRATEYDRATHADLAWHYHWESLGCTDDAPGRQRLCDDFSRRWTLSGPRRPASQQGVDHCACVRTGAAT
jgi:tetratricopeptide (TPR) repeat protein